MVITEPSRRRAARSPPVSVIIESLPCASPRYRPLTAVNKSPCVEVDIVQRVRLSWGKGGRESVCELICVQLEV